MKPTVLTKNQKITRIANYREGVKNYRLVAEIRHDDECGNGHNSFSITGIIYLCDAKKNPVREECGGCIHDDIAKHLPDLAPFIKWHLCSTDGPMHYVANTVYLAGDRDHWGLHKGEFRQHTSSGKQNNGIEGVPHWELEFPEGMERSVYSKEKPQPITLEWKPSGITGEGKERELNAARSTAIWPEATDEELCLPPKELEAKLLARLPALMEEFQKAVESLGLVY